MAIQYAGSSDPVAVGSISHYLRYFLGRKNEELAKDVDEVLERSLSLCALALGVVCAGSGDPPVYRLCLSKLSRDI